MSILHQPPAGSGLGDPFGVALEAMSAGFADLAEAPVWSLPESRLDHRFAQAAAVRAAAEEMMARLAAEMESRAAPGRAGAPSLRAHLVATHRLSGSDAARVVKAARQLHGNGARGAVTDPVRQAQACGRVSAEQAVTIAVAVNRLDATIGRAEVDAVTADLIGHAARLSFSQLQQVANHAVEVVDPDGADAALEQLLRRQERDAYAGCELILSIQPDGTSHGRFRHLPAVPTAILKKALDTLTAPRRLTPNPDTGVGGDPEVERLVETAVADLPYGSRLGRAFGELLEHLPTDGLPGHGASPVTVVVTLDEQRLRQQAGEALLDTGTGLSVGETRRLLCNAGIVPAVLGSDSAVLDLGRGRRLFDRHQRLALTVRDRGCVFPGCERPPAWCEAHHAIAWSEGGPTDLSHGALVCCFHHHLIHQDQWRLVIAPDGIPEAIPPPRIDPAQHPIRHQRFTPRRE